MYGQIPIIEKKDPKKMESITKKWAETVSGRENG